MTEKTVYCRVNERVKRVSYVQPQGVSDLECIKTKFAEVVMRDASLQQIVKNRSVVFQFTNKRGKLCDIEEDDVLEDGCDVTVLIVLKEFSVISEKFTDNDLQMDVSYNIIQPDAAQATTVQNATNSNSNVKSKKNKILQRVSYPASLPELTDVLKHYLETGQSRAKERYFVQFWAAHLLKVTDDKPSKTDYLNYVLTIVQSFPQFKKGKNECGVLKSELSTHITNARYVKNKALKRKMDNATRKENSEERTISIKPHENEVDENSALSELKNVDPKEDSAHTLRLLQETMSVRRKWILSDGGKAVLKIVREYPQLKESSLILHEFGLLKSVEIKKLYESAELTIKKLANFFSLEIKNEHDKAIVLDKLNTHLVLAKHRNVNEPLISIAEAGFSTKELNTSTECAPRLIIYFKDSLIVTAFIVATENVRVKIPHATIAKLITSLVGVYYVWNVEYPTAYVKTLTYFDSELLGTAHNKKVIDKFIRDVNYEYDN